MTRLLFIAYFLEVGLLLVLVPWSAYWDRNALLTWVPQFEALARNPFVRGAVSGLGLVNLMAGALDLAGLVKGRHP